ncbi:MAG TPA: hypothetical protein PKA58_12665 [Polyangium sp.]|jgi:MYXO-CTERM domain-containing protein|nr:hypothetical protein [Polyangium sp.]
MMKKLISAIILVGGSAIASQALADVAPSGPSCRCEVPGSTASGPLEMGVSALVFAMGVVIVARRRRR